MTNISDVFLQAEEETKRAEAMLAKWKKLNNEESGQSFKAEQNSVYFKNLD